MPRYERDYGLNTALPSTGKSGAYSRLSQSLQSFGGTADRIGANFKAQQAQRDAGRLEPSTEAPELRSPATVYGQQYNAAVLEGHLAATRNAYQMQLEQIAAQHALDPGEFAKSADEIRGAVLQGAAPEVQAALSLNFDRDANSMLLDIQRAQAKAASAEAAAAVSDAFDGVEGTIYRLIRQGDEAGAVAQIAEYRAAIEASEVLTPDQKRDRLDKVQKGAVEQGMIADMDEMEVADAYEYLDRVAGDVPEMFAPDEWDKVVQRAQTVLKQRAARDAKMRDAVRKEHAREVSDLEVEIAAGVGDVQEQVTQIERLFDADIIDGSKRTSLLKAINDNAEKTIDDSVLLGQVMERLAGDSSIVVQPSDIDKVYEKQLAPDIPEDGNAHKAMIADRMKYVPKAMRQEVVNGLRSGDPALVARSADLLDRLDDVHGLPENSFSKQDRAFASSVMELSQYLPPEEAIKLARQNTDPTDQARIEGQRAMYDAEFDNRADRMEQSLDQVGERFDFEVFGNTVDELTRFDLARDFDRLTEEYVVAGMDIARAQDQAEKDMKRVWGVSDVTGEGRTMRYPPENYYGAGNNEWMQAQLRDDVATVWPGEYQSLHLRADGVTAREAGTGRPSYIVVVVDENGINPLVDFRWRPDRTEAAAAVADERKREFDERRARVLEPGTPDGDLRRRLMQPGAATSRALGVDPDGTVAP